MAKLRAAVIGVGKLGSLHAAKYARKDSGAVLSWVADVVAERAREIADATGAAATTDFREVIGRVDLASVATPTSSHFEIAAALLDAGIPVLVEKPLAATAAAARELAALAERTGTLLQVGYLERFNPIIRRLCALVRNPRFIETHRLAPFTERCLDVDVILDLMSHDLDLVMALGGSEVASVEAIGVPVLTDFVDLANARIKFRNGLTANLNASRVAPRRERKVRVFQPDAYMSVDLEARTLHLYRKEPPTASSSYPTISSERFEAPDGDPLSDEIASFIRCVVEKRPPLVGASAGVKVVELCERIAAAMADSLASSA